MVTKDADRDAGTPQLLNAVGYQQFRFSNQLMLPDQTYSRTVCLPCNYDISELLFQNRGAVAQWLERATDNTAWSRVRILLKPFGNFDNFLYPTLPTGVFRKRH